MPPRQSILTLWSLVQSPLIFGGDATNGTIPDAVLSLLTNPLLLALGAEIDHAEEAMRSIDAGEHSG